MRTKFTNAPQTSAGESEWLALVGNAWPEEAWATGMREGPKDVNVDGHPMADHVAPPPPPAMVSPPSPWASLFLHQVQWRCSHQGLCSVSHAVPTLYPALSRAQHEEHRSVRSRAQSPAGGQDLPSTESVSGSLVSLETRFPASQE